MKRFKEWMQINMHTPLKLLITNLNRKLVGYYRYYGITDNSYSIKEFRYYIRRQLYKVLNRRSQRRSYNWDTFEQMMRMYPLAMAKLYVNIFELKPSKSY